ncbi:MAG: SRPBCC family protein [Deltaproteobacteria bacterium]|nr:SRPBCC family protein [Deltaproteobacteria bacterium]
MHYYSYQWNKEADDEFIYFPYKLIVTVNLPAREMWKQWEICQSDADNSWWPTQYSRIHFDELPIRAGAKYHLTYTMPDYRNPGGPPLTPKYDYCMFEWDPEKMTCRYGGTGSHPFRGGATFTVKEIDKNTCQIVWDGKYQIQKGAKGARGYEWHSARFFNEFLISVAESIEKHTR